MIYFTNTIISWTTVLILVGYGDRTPQVKALLTYCTGTVSPYWETTWQAQQPLGGHIWRNYHYFINQASYFYSILQYISIYLHHCFFGLVWQHIKTHISKIEFYKSFGLVLLGINQILLPNLKNTIFDTIYNYVNHCTVYWKLNQW